MNNFVIVAFLILTWIVIAHPPRVHGKHNAIVLLAIYGGHTIIVTSLLAAILFLLHGDKL